MPITKCNCLPYQQNATAAQKCMRAGSALVAITTFVVGLLGLLTSLNLLNTALGPIGTIGSGCMLGGAFLILAALYLTRGKEGESGLALGSVSQLRRETVYPIARNVARNLHITDLKERLNENYRVKSLDVSLEPAPDTNPMAHEKALELLIKTESQFLNTPLSSLGNETAPPYNILLEALTFRFHSITHSAANSNPLLRGIVDDLAAIPFMSPSLLIGKIRYDAFPSQALFCLSPEQVNSIFKEIYGNRQVDQQLLGKIGPHLFPSYPIGKYADAHMKKVFKGIDVKWRAAFLVSSYVQPHVRAALENDLNRS